MPNGYFSPLNAEQERFGNMTRVSAWVDFIIQLRCVILDILAKAKPYVFSGSIKDYTCQSGMARHFTIGICFQVPFGL